MNANSYGSFKIILMKILKCKMKCKCTVAIIKLTKREASLISAIRAELVSVKFCSDLAVDFHFITRGLWEQCNDNTQGSFSMSI